MRLSTFFCLHGIGTIKNLEGLMLNKFHKFLYAYLPQNNPIKIIFFTPEKKNHKLDIC